MADERYEDYADESELAEGQTVPEDDPAPELGDLPYAYKLDRLRKNELVRDAHERTDSRVADEPLPGESSDSPEPVDDPDGGNDF